MALDLYIKDGESDPAIIIQDGGDPPANFTITTDILDYDKYATRIVGSFATVTVYRGIRDRISALVTAQGGFSSLTTPRKEVASKWGVVDKSDRDTVHTAAEQAANAELLSTRILTDATDSRVTLAADNMKDADVTEIDEVISVFAETWEPPANVADYTVTGVANVANVGAGYRGRMGSSGTDSYELQIPLSGVGVTYDGSDLALEIGWLPAQSAPAGSAVVFETKYAFIHPKGVDNSRSKVTGTLKQAINITTRTQDRYYEDILETMIGEVGATLLQITFSRLADDVDDTYSGNVCVGKLRLIKQ